jgi:hypothetical protein
MVIFVFQVDCSQETPPVQFNPPLSKLFYFIYQKREADEVDCLGGVNLAAYQGVCPWIRSTRLVGDCSVPSAHFDDCSDGAFGRFCWLYV